MNGLGRYYELDVTCRGNPHPITGYFINIKLIDDAVRTEIIPFLSQTIADDPTQNPAALLPKMIAALENPLQKTVAALTWRLHPTLSLIMKADDMTCCIYRQRFAFAASHRLHCPDLAPKENAAIFGKCNNPNGHGHNYQVEVAIETACHPDDSTTPFNLGQFEALVQTTLIERFDHRNLNADCAEFKTVNPTVENISRISYELLLPSLQDAGIKLRDVTIWETEKTSCVYPG